MWLFVELSFANPHRRFLFAKCHMEELLSLSLWEV